MTKIKFNSTQKFKIGLFFVSLIFDYFILKHTFGSLLPAERFYLILFIFAVLGLVVLWFYVFPPVDNENILDLIDRRFDQQDTIFNNLDYKLEKISEEVSDHKTKN